jgi:hypothetical protein
MSALRYGLLLLVLALLPLAGCLEVNQHPGWVRGAYDGKKDDRPSQARFNGDRLSWNAVVSNRTQRQNEYIRMP